jgi:hypothetical protein
MDGVKKTAVTLSDANVPAVEVANNVERTSLKVMYAARGYAFTEQDQFLKEAKTNLVEVDKFFAMPSLTTTTVGPAPSSQPLLVCR